MVQVSACVITKNEENCISRCLQSVRNIADEMIVVDTGSTDTTVSIAEKMGAKVFYYQWCNDFSAARNYALEQANGDWIIFLDADEYIAGDKIKNVRPAIMKIHGDRTIDAIRCMLSNLEGVNGQLRTANPTIRIFRNSKAIRYEGMVHESIVKRGKRNIQVINIEQRVLAVYHTGYTKNTIDEKIRRNAVLLEEELKRGIVRQFTYCYLSDSYLNIGKYGKAIEFAHKAIEYMGQINRDIDYKPYVIIIKCIICLKAYSEKEAALICDEAVQKFPHHPEIWLQQGLYYRSVGRFEKSLSSLLKAISANACYTDFNRSNDFYIASSQAFLNIAQLYEMKNESAQALGYYVKTLQQEKFNQTAFRGLILLIRRQEPADVIYFLNTLYNLADEEDISFLVQNLSRLKVKKVLDYYQQILLDKFNNKTLNGLVLLNNCKFEEVFPIFVDSFLNNGQYDMELLTVISLLIAGRPDLIDSLGPQLHLSFGKIVAGFFQLPDGLSLSTDDFSCFSDLVREVAYMGLEEQLEGLLQLGKRFLSIDELTKIGNLFLEHSFFHYALDIYLYNIYQANSKQPKLLYYGAGYCCYKLKDFAGAANYFSEALERGYQRHGIFELLEWSCQQSSDVLLKEKFRMLKDGYGK